MDQVLALRPFVPARDFVVSKRFYKALGFAKTLEEPPVAVFKLGSFSFILQNYFVAAMADNVMVQLLVRDVDRWWDDHDPQELIGQFTIKPPVAPAIQPWGMKVGFIHDPSGVLWHVAEAPF